MKMHPKPMVRHSWPVIHCTCEVQPDHKKETIDLVYTIDGRTQRVVMFEDEAARLIRDLHDAIAKLHDG